MASPPKEVHYYRTAERPDVRLWLTDSAGNLVDLSAGYTFELKLGNPGSAATLTKSSGLTGAAGAGVEPTGTPNLVVSLTSAEFDGLTPGTTTLQIRARLTAATADRFWQCSFVIHDVIT